MKAMLVVAFVCSCPPLFAQQPADSLFLVTYSLGENWDANKAPADQEYFKQHSAHLGALRKEGVIQIGARYANKGMIVIVAATTAEAARLITSDEAIVHKLFRVEIHKMSLFYDGCLNKRP
ncbi:MAG: hypothetical protein HC859_10835 [Bacteroidia bacterium]|nr:hypothetical protein [Bacteroidia bacterium]